MIRNYGELVSACTPEASAACVRLSHLPTDVLDALATLLAHAPSLTKRDSADLELQRVGKALLIRDVHQATLLFPEERIARRFERLGEFCQSLSDLMLLREMRKADETELPLIFKPDQLGEDIGEALGRLWLHDPTLMRVAQEVQAQLALVFNIRTLAQLVLKLSIVLDERLQIVCADFQRALINAFWDWADANKLYVLYRLLVHKRIVMSDQAFFLYYTKLLDRMTATRQAGVDALNNDGRLRLPLANDPLLRAVPQDWWQQMSRRFERIKIVKGAELVSMQTEPPIWQLSEGG
ncbi:MAG: hypothetical protein HC853_01255 [Anaerolineae bacterium]|nr:hypothetical protein [Anaerolineae bacterium]